MKRAAPRPRIVAAMAAGLLVTGTAATGQDHFPAAAEVAGALSWAARAEVLDASGEVLRVVNATLLEQGAVVQTACLDGADRVRIHTRSGNIWESAACVNTHPMIGLSLLQLPERPSSAVVFPQSGSYMARMRVFLIHGPGLGPDSSSARIYQNFQTRDFPDLCPIDAGIVGAAPAVDSTGRFLGVACDLSDGPMKFGYIVPAVSVAVLGAGQTLPRPIASVARSGRPGFEDAATAAGLLFRGAVLTQIGQPEEARRVLRAAEERDPSLNEIYYWSGLALFAQERYREATEEFQYAAGKDSTNYKTWHLAGAAFHQAGEYDEAEKMYLQALRVKPNAADTYCNLGGTYLSLKRPREAEEAWRTSIRIDPRSQDGLAFYNLASKLKHDGRAAAVDSVLDRLFQVNPAWEQRVREAMERSHH